MQTVIGVRFKRAGKVYYFDPDIYEIKSGEYVIVETIRGIEYGTVVYGNKEVMSDEIIQPLKRLFV
jgi:cell fate regulator YaaT (PSP1 superfamily)